MKKWLLLVALMSTVFVSNAQEKIRYNLLNRNAPDGYGVGIKWQGNYHLPQYTVINDGFDAASSSSVENVGYGMGFYYRNEFNDNWGLQTELNFNFRQGRLGVERSYSQDTTLAVTRDRLSNFNIFNIEIPIYLKWRKEFIPRHKGHWKSKSALGILLGPRVVLSPYSRRDISKITRTTLYEQESVSVEPDATDLLSDNRISPLASMGVSLGVDYELWNGFIAHVAYYRGFLTHTIADTRVKAMDNRIEFGIGYRFN